MMQQFREAQRICAGCPSRNPCLADAFESGDVHGIRAGLGEKERRKLIRAAGARTIRRYELAPCGTLAAYQRHHRRREPVCEACAAVNRRNSADRAKARREAAA
jgi:WhiB family redox-sensing transcriptional regulator